MEKLSIRNFGPIEKADIDLKRITVLIGPQGSGKSTIAKIIGAYGDYTKLLKKDWLADVFIEKLKEDYGLNSYFGRGTKISLKNANGEFDIDNSAAVTMVNEEDVPYGYKIPESIYIPAERVLIPLITENSFLFIREKISMPKYITDFGILFQNARKNIKEHTIDFLDGVTYSYDDNIDKVKLKNGKVITLSESSNGIQTTLPLLIAVRYLSERAGAKKGKNISFSIEEPELSLFPSTQNELLKFILQLILPLDYHLVITTHSPYTLTALNNLIYAFQVGESKKDVKDIVPESLWLNPEDVGAWYIDNGTARSIIDNEIGQIKAEEIDKISDVLNQEYDMIMDKKYEQRK